LHDPTGSDSSLPRELLARHAETEVAKQPSDSRARAPGSRTRLGRG
jgi:hypothetical protein